MAKASRPGTSGTPRTARSVAVSLVCESGDGWNTPSPGDGASLARDDFIRAARRELSPAIGFLFRFDNVPWNAHDLLEHQDSVASWILGVHETLAETGAVFVWAWEESQCHLRREGEFLMVQDLPACPPVRMHHLTFLKCFLPPAELVVGLFRDWETERRRLLSSDRSELHGIYARKFLSTPDDLPPLTFDEAVDEFGANSFDAPAIDRMEAAVNSIRSFRRRRA